MFRSLSKWSEQIRIWMRIGQDAWNVIMLLTFGAAAASVQTYLAWGQEHPYAVFLFAIIAFAAAALIGCAVIWIGERNRVKGRIKMQQIVPHFAEVRENKFALTPRMQIVNRSQVTVGWAVKKVHFQVGPQSSQSKPPDKTNVSLPNDHGWVMVRTIPDIPVQNQTKGHVYLDVHYGVEGKDLEYRMEWESDIDVAIVGQEVLITPLGSQVTHTRLERR